MTATAMKPWAELEGRERDAAVAEVVLGQKPPERATYDQREKSWGHYRDVGGNGWWFESVWPQRYTTNASDDYRVLEFVRREWDDTQQLVFRCCLYDIHAPRAGDNRYYSWCIMGYYEPGDYSAAAYEAKRLSQETTCFSVR